MTVVKIDGPAYLVIPGADEAIGDADSDAPMWAIMFELPGSPRRYGYVLEAYEAQAQTWADELKGRTLVARVPVHKGQFDDLPAGTDTGNVPESTKLASYWFAKDKPPQPPTDADRWGKLDKPRNADLHNGAEARVVVQEGVIVDYPPGTPEFKPPM